MRLITLIIVLVALSLESGAMRAEDIQIKNWPEDVPCNAVKKNPDGSYTQPKELMMGRMRMEKRTPLARTPRRRAHGTGGASAEAALEGFPGLVATLVANPAYRVRIGLSFTTPICVGDAPPPFGCFW